MTTTTTTKGSKLNSDSRLATRVCRINTARGRCNRRDATRRSAVRELSNRECANSAGNLRAKPGLDNHCRSYEPCTSPSCAEDVPAGGGLSNKDKQDRARGSNALQAPRRWEGGGGTSANEKETRGFSRQGRRGGPDEKERRKRETAVAKR